MAVNDPLGLLRDVSPLPNVKVGRADLYFRFPVAVTADRADEQLRRAGFELQPISPLLFVLPDVEPLKPLRAVVEILSPPEQEETFALLRPCGGSFKPADQMLAMNVVQLHDRLAGAWLWDMLRAQSVGCVFQAIVRADDTTSVVGYEALLRGYDHGDEISPLLMVHAAESAHVMSHLDALAMQVALTEAARCKLPGKLFLNCSPLHMYEPETRIGEIVSACGQLGLDPSQIVLEVTETESNEPEHLRRFIDACRPAGFSVAIDDVGVGYSALDMLSAVRPEIVKIDRGLVSAINTDPYRALILSRLLDATRILGILTIIEGIETEAELAWARSNGATYVQGNLLDRPAARDAFVGRT